jgi:hypothetical protein
MSERGKGRKPSPNMSAFLKICMHKYSYQVKKIQRHKGHPKLEIPWPNNEFPYLVRQIQTP